LVERSVRVGEVIGSNPVTPTVAERPCTQERARPFLLVVR
jgi:hypothetical protein